MRSGARALSGPRGWKGNRASSEYLVGYRLPLPCPTVPGNRVSSRRRWHHAERLSAYHSRHRGLRGKSWFDCAMSRGSSYRDSPPSSAGRADCGRTPGSAASCHAGAWRLGFVNEQARVRGPGARRPRRHGRGGDNRAGPTSAEQRPAVRALPAPFRPDSAAESPPR